MMTTGKSIIDFGTVQIIYCSHVVNPQDSSRLEQDIDHIVRYGRIENARLGITGALLTDKASFAQVIEGPATSIEHMYSKIVDDKRHHGVELLQCVVTHVRLLPLRALAFVEVDRIPHIDGINGYSTPSDRRRACFSVFTALRPLLLG